MPKVHKLTGGQMESTYLVFFSIVLGVVVVSFGLTTLTLWSRQSGLLQQVIDLSREFQKKEPTKAIEKAVIVAESARDRMDNTAQEIVKFREGIHQEMQRFYGIMRRNEKTLAAQPSQPSTEEAELPEEMSAASFKKKEGEEPEVESRADLRARARAQGL